LDSLPNVTVLPASLADGDERSVELDEDYTLGATVLRQQFSDIDDIKALVGSSDSAARKRVHYPVSRVFSDESYEPDQLVSEFRAGRFTDDMQRFANYVEDEYLYGDSETVRPFKGAIEEILLDQSPAMYVNAVCFGVLRIRNGYTLVIPAFYDLVCAKAILLEPKARIKILGQGISFNVSVIKVVEPQLPLAFEK
jgi:hypothetical protein